MKKLVKMRKAFSNLRNNEEVRGIYSLERHTRGGNSLKS